MIYRLGACMYVYGFFGFRDRLLLPALLAGVAPFSVEICRVASLFQSSNLGSFSLIRDHYY